MLLEFSSNYSYTTGSLFYSKDEQTYVNNDIANNDGFKSFKYKAKLLGNNEPAGVNWSFKNTTIDVSLKYLSNFLKSLEIPLPD